MSRTLKRALYGFIALLAMSPTLKRALYRFIALRRARRAVKARPT